MPTPDDDDDEFFSSFDEEDTAGQPHGLRFGEGQPINRNGRPCGSPNVKTLVKRVAKMRLRVKIDGRSRTKSAIELVLTAVQKKAAEGDMAAFKIQRTMLERYQAPDRKRTAVLITGRKMTELEWAAVYGNSMTDEEVMESCPYMMIRRRESEQSRAKSEGQLAAAKEEYQKLNRKPIPSRS